VCLEGIVNCGCKVLMSCLKPSPSTTLKGCSSKIMNLETALLQVSALNLWLAAPKVGHKVKTV
jgi:hypothetical protein